MSCYASLDSGRLIIRVKVDSGLYVVATPIGNLGDITHRAIEVLQEANLIAAEDTRHSLRLLQHFNIDTPLLAYHDHSGERSREKIERILENDGVVALISDAGTPLISDPGYRLVRDIQGKGYPVRPIPGPSAAVAALSVSGLATDRFMFEGFLPARAGARTGRLKELATQSATLVFYSLLAPGPDQIYPDAVSFKSGLDTYVGNLTGRLPAADCGVEHEHDSLGQLKARF